MKRVKKILLYAALAFLVIATSAIASLFLFKDRIIQQFVREANKSLGTPITIGKIDASVFQDFPKISIVFTDVYVEESPGRLKRLFSLW